MKIITTALILIAVGLITFISISIIDSNNGNDLSKAESKFVVSDVPKNGLPSERDFSDDIHHMTHEKIHATQKWGRLEITTERISEMIAIAEKSDYEYKNMYIETLTEWQNGNFENAVNVHNTIWNEKNGNIGKATRMMTDKEQQEYKEAYYE